MLVWAASWRWPSCRSVLSAPCSRCAGKEFIRVIEQTQPEFRDKVRPPDDGGRLRIRPAHAQAWWPV